MNRLRNTTQANIRPVEWIGLGATALVVIGVGMNMVVMQTLGSFSAAAVILALYLAFWAYVLGSVGLTALAIWLLARRKFSGPERRSVNPEIKDPHGVARDRLSPRKVA